MVIVYCCNEKYMEIFAVSLVSLYENNREADHLNVYLIGDGLKEESIARINQLANHYGRKVEFVSAENNNKLKELDIALPNVYSLDTFRRLLIASYLPQSICKAIYIDCDTIVLGSIQELWETDLGEYSIGMVNDCANPSYRKSLGLKGKEIYYNAGVCVVNLEIWRKRNIEEQFLNFIIEHRGYVPIVDQGVINAVLDRQIRLLPLKYNVYTAWYAFTYMELCNLRRPFAVYPEEEVRKACNNPIIVHFTNNFYMPLRPWIKGSTHPFAKKWMQYRKMTPWDEDPMWEDSRSNLGKLYTLFCHHIPKKITIFISRTIQSYVMPMQHQYKMKIKNKINLGNKS